MSFSSFHAILIIFNFSGFWFNYSLGQDVSGSLSFMLVYNGKDLDTSGIKQIFSGEKDDMTLISAVPSDIKDQMPKELKSALQNETVSDLKKEIEKAKEAMEEAKTPQDFKEQLDKVAPETEQVVSQTINWIYKKFKDSLDKEEEDFVNQLVDKLNNTYNYLKDKINQDYQNLDSNDKQNLTFSAVFGMMSTSSN